MRTRAVFIASMTAGAALALGACGASVAKGGENAATNPAAGIWVARTVGGAVVSTASRPLAATYTPPPSTPPATPPPGEGPAVWRIEAAVRGGCWEDAHAGNIYGAYDQLFWWQGNCGDTAGQVTVELYPSAGAAVAQARHTTVVPLQARYRDGAVLVDVYSNAPLSVVTQLGAVPGLAAVPGYLA